MKRKIAKNVKSCLCEIHIQMDKQLKKPIPCIGHGKNCPCTEFLMKKAEVPEEKPIP